MGKSDSKPQSKSKAKPANSSKPLSSVIRQKLPELGFDRITEKKVEFVVCGPAMPGHI